MLLDSHVTSLTSIQEISKYVYLFLTACIVKQRDSFGHGHSINERRLNTMIIMIPIRKDGDIDYDYMDAYMRYLEYKQIKEYIAIKR